MHRRQAVKIVVLSAVAPAAWRRMDRAVSEPALAWATGDYHLQFFSEEETRFLDQLMEMIIPADEHSPGASAARVSLFADRMVSAGDAAEKRNWRMGLKLMRDEAGAGSIADAL